MVLANKKSADYVKSLANNTVPKQLYLYQRRAEEAAMRLLSSPMCKGDLVQKSSANTLIEHDDSFEKINNNLDIEFEKIDEARQMEELSPGVIPGRKN